MLKDSLTMLPLFGWAFSLHGCVYVSKTSRQNRGGAAAELVSRTRRLGEDGIP
jgi:1-acyl-sn-glycerol-3-phosphate acyltransferase